MDKQNISFGIITDIQYSNSASFQTRYYKNSASKLKKCINILNKNNLSFVIDLGDIIDENYENFNIILNVYKKLRHKLYFTFGNHDFNIKDKYKHNLKDLLGMKNKYYDFLINKWRFIVLNGTEQSLYAYPKFNLKYWKSKKVFKTLFNKNKINAYKWNGGISKTQINWLKKILNKSKNNNEKVIIFSHFPIYPIDKHNLWNYENLLKIITSYCNIKAFISGHNHEGNYGKINKTHFITLKALVETINENSFSIFHINNNSLEINGYGREKSKKYKL